ncbi:MULTISPECIES: CotH kinase family protein [unclassified Lentimicrobium]|uniref:CotH kinase family protein n=1 Tax=unclassified Lentimicrobium TaxID=2677434 RepID=UPI0015548661|nr:MULTISPECIES: CotH kinase family protein [unclassified Lentimicrobium]NPD46305.1 hypothetical protein [Lentimicrobium sp. S6]NPD85303.1 hypothetical protein [Lentimicrobium sp. L6]
MTKPVIIISILIMFLCLFSCTKYIVNEEYSIDPAALTIENIQTALNVIHITADTVLLDSMMHHPSSDVEIDAFFSYFSQDQSIIKDKKIELKIKGTSTVFYPLKSLKVKFKKKVNNISSPILQVDQLLPNHSINELKKISLRNSGNDLYGTFVKDISFTDLAIQLGLDLELSYHQPVQVFLNESFYGLLNLRTEKDDNSLGKLLNVDNDEVNILKISHIRDGQEVLEFGSGNEQIINNLIEAVHTKDSDFLLNNIDLNCFADYIIFEDFIGNSDWPYNNVEIYNVGPNGKFRFFLYDMDFAASADRLFVDETGYNGFLKKLFDTLKTDADFATSLKRRQKEIYHQASPNLFKSIVEKNANRIEDEIKYNMAKYDIPRDHIAWYYELERLQEQFEMRYRNFGDHYKIH